MVEEISDKFERAMKKGFISTLVLLVLENKPTHGYQIIKEIEERTLGMWKPPTSTMYTILESLKDKELIQPIEQPETDERKIIYELTIKGKETLKIMLQKEKEIRESMKSIIGSTFGFSEDLMEEESFEFPFKKHFFGKPTGPFPGSLNGLSKDEKLETLNLRKNFISKRISALSLMLQNIEKQISELESENDT